MTRILTILLAFCLAPLSAAAQVAVSTTGDVGSTATRNGYPIGGGAVSLPSGTRADGTAVTTTATTTATGTTAGGGGGSGSVGAIGSGASGSGGGGSASTSSSGSRGSTGRSSGGGGSHNWILCPPASASGIAPFLDGTDLSCAP